MKFCASCLIADIGIFHCRVDGFLGYRVPLVEMIVKYLRDARCACAVPAVFTLAFAKILNRESYHLR